jgi:surface protein
MNLNNIDLIKHNGSEIELIKWNGFILYQKNQEGPDVPEIPLYQVGQFKNNSTITEVRTMVNESHTNLSDMFYGCSSLRTVDTTNWNTSNVVTVKNMFRSCYYLGELDLSSFDTSKIDDMGFMFDGCTNLTTVGNLSNWDISNVTNMDWMFGGCCALNNCSFLSNWDVSNVYSMNSIFSGCANLTSLDLSNWITSDATYMNSMFSGCSNLETLDIRNFVAPSSFGQTDGLFEDCDNLHTIYMNNCDNSTILRLICNEDSIPTGTYNGETRKIYVKEENLINQYGRLTEPDGWEFICV